jgi:hypothetical protein
MGEIIIITIIIIYLYEFPASRCELRIESLYRIAIGIEIRALTSMKQKSSPKFRREVQI